MVNMILIVSFQALSTERITELCPKVESIRTAATHKSGDTNDLYIPALVSVGVAFSESKVVAMFAALIHSPRVPSQSQSSPCSSSVILFERDRAKFKVGYSYPIILPHVGKLIRSLLLDSSVRGSSVCGTQLNLSQITNISFAQKRLFRQCFRCWHVGGGRKDCLVGK
jgi:hypothetical protein